jgi:hypothetical protein
MDSGRGRRRAQPPIAFSRRTGEAAKTCFDKKMKKIKAA